MSARVSLRDVRENKVLWENPNLVFRQEYEAQSGQTQLDPSAFFGQDQNALDRMTNRVRSHDRERESSRRSDRHESMPLTTPYVVRKQIESGSVGPLYLLQGEDEIEKLALGHEFEALVDEGLRAFNVERLHAGDVTSGDRLVTVVSSLIAAAHTLPMMSPRRVVIVHQAEGLLIPKRESDAATRALDALEMLFKEAESQTTIVLLAAPLDKRSRMYKLLVKQAAARRMWCHRNPGGRRTLESRIASTAAGAQMDPAGGRLLAERSAPTSNG